MTDIQGTIPEVLNEPWAQDIRTSCENLNISKMKYPVTVVEAHYVGWDSPKVFHERYGKWAFALCSSKYYINTDTPNYAILTPDIVGPSLIIVVQDNMIWIDKLYFTVLRILHRMAMNLYRLLS